MKQFKAVGTKDEEIHAAVMNARKHYAKTNEHCQALCFGVLIWDSRTA